MTSEPKDRPEIDRPDAELAVVCNWQTRLGGQHVAAEALTAAWTDWPEGLLSRTCLNGTDGRALLEYAQWRDEAALLAAKPAPTMLAGASLQWQTAYRRYRSINLSASQAPGCIVIVRATFDTTDLEGRKGTIDAMIGNPVPEENAKSALLAAHFHISVDATSVLNYAEWTSEEAHKAFMAAPAVPQPATATGGPDGTTESLTNVLAGLTGSSVLRYLPYRTEDAPNR